MFNMIMIMTFILFLMMLLMYINIFLSKKIFNQKEKSTSIECGFNLMNKFNVPFSIQFYYISILFLIFDVEISLILPLIQKITFNIINKWILSFIIILVILLIGLYYEWYNNLIKWF